MSAKAQAMPATAAGVLQPLHVTLHTTSSSSTDVADTQLWRQSHKKHQVNTKGIYVTEQALPRDP